MIISLNDVKSKKREKKMPKKTEAVEKMPERKDIPEKYRWDLAQIYQSDDAWEKDKNTLNANFDEIRKFQGKLLSSKEILLKCLKLAFDEKKRVSRLANFAMMKNDEDSRVSKYQGMKGIATRLTADYLAATSFIEPELLAGDEKTLKSFALEKSLADFDHYLFDVLRKKPHYLSPQEENLLAKSIVMGVSPHNTYKTFTAADMDFPEITLHDGKKVKLSQAMYTKYRVLPDRNDRKLVFDAFFSIYTKYKNTFAEMLNACINADVFYASARKYGSSLEAALDQYNLPVKLYHNLIKSVNDNIPSLHRYLELRKKMMGIEKLYYYDLYPPVIKQVEIKITYDQSIEYLKNAFAPLGKEYLDAFLEAVNEKNRWVDVYPSSGKRSGAYMSGEIYDVHPYMLLNHNDDYDSASTFAHEMGHAMHSYFSNKNQPFSKSNYSTFVAEVASIFNEALLMEYMLKTEKNRETRIFLLGEYLELVRTTMFRQTMFAEFELEIHSRAENNQPLTAEDFSGIYGNLVKKYYGHEKNITIIDDAYVIEWAFIPHFYYNYYVYQYVTGLVAGIALSQKVIREGDAARERYIQKMLKAGDSKYPLEILREAGADMTSKEPYETTISVFNEKMDEIERLLKLKE
jgi:oligoendopeptidase F